MEVTALALSISGGFSYGYHSGVAGPSFGPMHSFHGNGTVNGLLSEVLGCDKTGCHTWTTATAVGSFIVGAMALNLAGGAIVAGMGRRRTVILAALLSLFGSALTLCSVSLWTFCLFRAITGGGIGLVSFIVPMCIAEMCSDPDSRGRIIGYFPLSIVTGILMSYLVGVGASYVDGSLAFLWRLVYAVVLLPGEHPCRVCLVCTTRTHTHHFV
jgi:MFS family permease